jgi:hypothetical protein
MAMKKSGKFQWHVRKRPMALNKFSPLRALFTLCSLNELELVTCSKCSSSYMTWAINL